LFDRAEPGQLRRAGDDRKGTSVTIVVTRATGATAKPVGLLYIEPGHQVLDAGSATSLIGSGLNPATLADLLSACTAPERCGVHLYRSVSQRTTRPELRERYLHFLQETMDHVDRLEQLIVAAGGDPHYVSPSARITEKAGAGLVESTYLLGGSVDPMTAEVAMLEAVMLAEAKDRANWELLAGLCPSIADRELRGRFEAVTAEVLAQEEEHYGWAHDTRALLLAALVGADGSGPASAAPTEIDLRDLSRDELYAAAQDADIPGRSQMTKQQLARAVAQQTGGRR
jgi:rubrerythrin